MRAVLPDPPASTTHQLPSASTPEAPGAKHTTLLNVGDRVLGRTNRGWKPAVVTCENDDGTFDISFDHGSQGKSWRFDNIQLPSSPGTEFQPQEAQPNSPSPRKSSSHTPARKRLAHELKALSQPLYYQDYLNIDTLTSLTIPQSRIKHGPKGEQHEETLFMIVHQTAELWFKLTIHEIGSVIGLMCKDYVAEDTLSTILQRLRRVNMIIKLVSEHFTILESMTPQDFLDFRDDLFPASGFQSVQFRIIENALGLDPNRRLKPGGCTYLKDLQEKHARLVESIEQKPSVFTVLEGWLERCPFVEHESFNWWETFKGTFTERLDKREKYILSDQNYDTDESIREQIIFREITSLRAQFDTIFDDEQYEEMRGEGEFRMSHAAFKTALMISLHRQEPVFQQPFQLMKELIEMDDNLAKWRLMHKNMAQRMLGTKVGTGGTGGKTGGGQVSGFQYLHATIDAHRIFGDLERVSTYLVPKRELPMLPSEFQKVLRGYFSTAPMQTAVPTPPSSQPGSPAKASAKGMTHSSSVQNLGQTLLKHTISPSSKGPSRGGNSPLRDGDRSDQAAPGPVKCPYGHKASPLLKEADS